MLKSTLLINCIYAIAPVFPLSSSFTFWEYRLFSDNNETILTHTIELVHYKDVNHQEKNAVPILRTAFFMIISSYFFYHK